MPLTCCRELEQESLQGRFRLPNSPESGFADRQEALELSRKLNREELLALSNPLKLHESSRSLGLCPRQTRY